jgi:hypothetical protein
MRVTQRWCSSCEGEGKLIDVTRYQDVGERGLPASRAKEMSADDDAADDEPDYGQIIDASKPYECQTCAGRGYYFYSESMINSGEALTWKQLSPSAELVDISGPHRWVEEQQSKPVLPLSEDFKRAFRPK